jgi:histidinol-phosphatase (PHP family)
MHFDTHVHSALSHDCTMDAKEAIDCLKQKGLGIIFTEHVDFATLTEGRDATANDAPRIPCDCLVDFVQHEREYKPLRGDTVLLGLEFSLNAAYLPLNTQTAGGDFDFILGAIHTVDGLDLYYDAKEEEPAALMHRYLTYMKEMVNISGFFDSLAHIDYICRYNPATSPFFKYDLYKTEFDAVLKALVGNNKAIELNTARIGADNEPHEAELCKILSRFRALGGQYVTIGSDAHSVENLGNHYTRALHIAKNTGLTPVYYKERKLQACKGAGNHVT